MLGGRFEEVDSNIECLGAISQTRGDGEVVLAPPLAKHVSWEVDLPYDAL